jgi:hypothetical protein
MVPSIPPPPNPPHLWKLYLSQSEALEAAGLKE